MSYEMLIGDNRQTLKNLPDNSVDSVVTDPPYGISFMSSLHGWDHSVPGPEYWKEVLRVLKPGGYILAFGGTRTFHRLVCAIEDSGFEIRDTIMWVYGSGFPKSHNVSKAIDKQQGNKRNVVGIDPARAGRLVNQTGDYTTSSGWSSGNRDIHITEGGSDDSKQWDGFGTALKPAYEPILLARKPITQTVAENVLQYGTGGLNIDGCRIGTEERYNPAAGNKPGGNSLNVSVAGMPENAEGTTVRGRFPANFIHDGSDEVKDLFPHTKSGAMKYEVDGYESESNTGFINGRSGPHNQYGDSGSAARFFYCAKASKKDRAEYNNHPTVKPTDLMRYLCRLVTPPGGTILDPFTGSGSTGKAALLEKFSFIGCEQDQKFFDIAEHRLKETQEEIESKAELPFE